MFYLRNDLAGEAHKALEGSFIKIQKMHTMHGRFYRIDMATHFIQKALCDELMKWPKIR